MKLKKIKIKNKNININLKKIKLSIKSNAKKDKFIKNIIKAKKYIQNGDIFQVVPSQRFEIDFKSKASSLYRFWEKQIHHHLCTILIYQG